MAKMTLKVKVNDSYFQYQPRVYHNDNACLVQIWWFQPKSVTSYRTDKPTFLEFYGKMAKMTLKVKINDPFFQYQLRLSHNSCLVQIWWFQPKSVSSYRADKPNFLEFEVKKAKMALKVKVIDPIFNTTREYPMIYSSFQVQDLAELITWNNKFITIFIINEFPFGKLRSPCL